MMRTVGKNSRASRPEAHGHSAGGRLEELNEAARILDSEIANWTILAPLLNWPRAGWAEPCRTPATRGESV